jgi:D-glycero-D-manno-heptose 1,7-bisphosphate phosphatase
MASYRLSSTAQVEQSEMGIDIGSRVRRAIFLDRDGVLNRNVWNPATAAWESPLTPEQFELLPKVIPALQLLRDAGYLLFLVSNQPNYAKGKASMRTLDAIHQRLEMALAEEHISFTACYYCFHHPAFTGHCVCRKPSPYFLLEARDTLGLDLEQSWMIGDRQADIDCGRAAGTRTVMIGKMPAEEAGADRVVSDLWAAAQVIRLL